MDRMQRLEKRLEALEQDAHRWRRTASRYRLAAALMLMIVLGGAGLAASAGGEIADVIRATRLEIVDAEGNLVLAAGSSHRGGQLDLWDNTGRNSLRLAVNDQGGDMAIWNSQGFNVYGAFATEAGGESSVWNAQGKRVLRTYGDETGGRIALHDVNDKAVVLAWAGQTGGVVDVRNAAGETVVEANADEAGGSLSVNNKDGRAVVMADADQQGAGLLMVADSAGEPRFTSGIGNRGADTQWFDEAGRPVATIGATAGIGASSLTLVNAEGKRVLSAGADESGCGRLALADEQGRVVLTANAVKDKGSALALFNPSGRKMFLMGGLDGGGLMNIMNRVGVPVFIAGHAAETLHGALSVKNGNGVAIFQAGAEESGGGIIRVYDSEGRHPGTLRPSP